MTLIKIRDEKTLANLRRLSRYLTVSHCTAGVCVEEALARINSERPELRKEVDKIIKEYTKTA